MTDKELHKLNIENLEEFVDYVKSGQAQKDVQEVSQKIDDANNRKKDNYLLTEGLNE